MREAELPQLETWPPRKQSCALPPPTTLSCPHKGLMRLELPYLTGEKETQSTTEAYSLALTSVEEFSEAHGVFLPAHAFYRSVKS